MALNKVANATKWSVLAEVTAKIAAPIVNIILARILTPDAYGVVASITIITSFADIFTDAGFQKYVIQHEYSSDAELNENSNVAFSSNFALSVLIYILIFAFKNKLAVAVGNPDAANGLAVAALSVLCTSFSSIVIARFRRNLEFKPLFIVRLSSALVPLFVTVPLAIVLKSYWALVLGTFIQQLFIAIAVTVLSKYKPRLFFNRDIFFKMVSFSAWNLCESLSIWFAGQANIFIVARVLNSYYLGLYRTGMTTINSYMALFTSAITPVLFSSLSRCQNDSKKFKSLFNHFQRLLAIIVIPMGFGVWMYRKLAVQVLLGSSWMEITNFMGLWALMSALTIVLSNLACEVYRSKGEPKVSFILQVIYLLYYIPVVFFSAKKGFDILCLASCLVRLPPIIFDLVTLRIRYNFKLRQIIHNILYPIFASVLMCLLASILQKIYTSVMWDFISIVSCVIFYGLIIFFNKTYRKEICSLVKKKR